MECGNIGKVKGATGSKCIPAMISFYTTRHANHWEHLMVLSIAMTLYMKVVMMDSALLLGIETES